ncbi:MAG: tetratricopeptide repeat protein, partial [Panacagrimonas sp.]
DTLCYFGPLEDVFQAAHTSLRPGGWLVFSVEDGRDQPDGHALQITGRYVHREDYVDGALERAGFETRFIEHDVLRSEMLVPVQGLICAARRSA